MKDWVVKDGSGVRMDGEFCVKEKFMKWGVGSVLNGDF